MGIADINKVIGECSKLERKGYRGSESSFALRPVLGIVKLDCAAARLPAVTVTNAARNRMFHSGRPSKTRVDALLVRTSETTCAATDIYACLLDGRDRQYSPQTYATYRTSGDWRNHEGPSLGNKFTAAA